MATVFDVAAYILQKHGSMSTMKLQKLVYYSQAWSLVWDDEPLFDEPIEAWVNGPVVPALFHAHKGKFSISWEDLPQGDPSNLSQDNKETIDVVLETYGDLTGGQLVELTHRDRPWIDARDGLAPDMYSNAVIPLDAMNEFYMAKYAESFN